MVFGLDPTNILGSNIHYQDGEFQQSVSVIFEG